MATIQGLTAPRMLEIEAAAIVAGVVDENMHLILTKHDGTTIDAGKVQGDGVPMGGTEGQIIVKTLTGSQWVNNFATNVEQTIKNNTGATLTKGTAVFVSGATGNNVLVSKAQANSEGTSSKTLGLLHADIANGAVGGVITEGTLYGFNTSAATVGDPVWLSPTTAGGLVYGLANKPTVPNHMVYLGVVIRSHAVNGAIYVKVQNGYELDELHDVKITNPQPKQVIKRDPTNSFWLNEAASGGVTVSETLPIDPSVGDGWFYSKDGTLFFRYFDGTNYAYVQADVPLSPTIEQRYYSPNYIINGGMDIWQRGTSFTSIANTYSADRWVGIRGAFDPGQNITQVSSVGVAGTRYAARVQRVAGNTSTNNLRFGTTLETSMSTPMSGKTVTLSFFARAGANFSSANNALFFFMRSGTGIDEGQITAGDNFPTGNTTVMSGTVNITTSWARYSFTGTVPTNSTQIGMRFDYTPAGTAGTNDWYEITGVQLEEGSVATPFRRNANSIQGELAACQRYFQKSYKYDIVPGTNAAGGGQQGAKMIYVPATGNTVRMPLFFPVNMRIAPTMTQYNPETGTAGYWCYEGSGASNQFAAYNTFFSETGVLIYGVAAGFVGNIYIQYKAEAEL